MNNLEDTLCLISFSRCFLQLCHNYPRPPSKKDPATNKFIHTIRGHHTSQIITLLIYFFLPFLYFKVLTGSDAQDLHLTLCQAYLSFSVQGSFLTLSSGIFSYLLGIIKLGSALYKISTINPVLYLQTNLSLL